MKLEDIGFYTLNDYRAKNVSSKSQLWRCELILTSRCNFNCPYCRGVNEEDKGDISIYEAYNTILMWTNEGLKNIRFSGGEPTLYKYLENLVTFSSINNIEKIAISTNGSNNLKYYKNLIKLGVNDFSISLDSCCASTGKLMSGGVSVFDRIINNIKELSKLTYVTVGIVITDDNIKEIDKTIKLASSLGVADIRVITAAQKSKYLPNISTLLHKHPILKYRIKNFYKGRPIRGINKDDTNKCSLVLDDMAVLNNKHYPCIIYLREGGNPIGKVNKNMREERNIWYLKHDTHKDVICKNNCLDVCVDYNNKVKKEN